MVPVALLETYRRLAPLIYRGRPRSPWQHPRCSYSRRGRHTAQQRAGAVGVDLSPAHRGSALTLAGPETGLAEISSARGAPEACGRPYFEDKTGRLPM